MKNALTITLALVSALAGAVAQAYDQGDWVLRVGATTVAPDTNSGTINLPDGLTAKADVDNDTQLGIIPAYMMTDNFGFELLAATPFKHDIEAKGQGAISGTNLDAGTTKQLPPTLMFQYYPRGGSPGWQPYLGAGLNYTQFFDEKVDNELINTLGALTDGVVDDADLSLDQSFGVAFQAGVDVPFSDHWAFNACVWYLDIDSKAKLTPKFQGMPLERVDFNVHIDPWVYNVGIAYRF